LVAGAAGAYFLGRPARRANVVLVTLDTFRPDHLGVEGHAGAHTPNLDRFANEGVRFRRCFSAAPVTLPSHSSIMTGVSPAVHGARDNGLYVLSPENDTLAELLQRNGYRTAAFVSSFPLRRRFGIDQGFQLFDDDLDAGRVRWSEAPPTVKDELLDQRSGDATMSAALGWLRQVGRERPFFLWIHLFDAHQPYEPPSPYKETFTKEPYDGEVAFVDEQFGRLTAELDALGLRRDTAVVVTGDHGEGLGDHGEVTHAMLTYDSTMRVPLLMRVPRLPTGRVVEEPVGLVDLFATVLDVAGVTTPASEGTSVLPLLRRSGPSADPWRAQALYFESEAGANGFGWAKLSGMRSGRWKYIRGAREELYDISTDPGEKTNLLADQDRAGDLATMRALLDRYLSRATPRAQPASTRLQQTAETRARLAALGYVSGPEGGAGDDPARAPDPTAHVNIINDWSAAREAIGGKDYDRATDRMARLLRYEPDNPSLLIMQGVLYSRTGRDADAIAMFERALPRAIKDAGAQAELADVYRRMGQPAKSIEALERCADLDPLQKPAYLISIAALKRSMGDLDGALAAARESARLAPERSEPHWMEGTLWVRRGDLAQAEQAFRRALAISPAEPRYHQNLAALHVDQGRAAEAVTEARAALKLAPEYPEARYVLGLALIRTGEMEAGRRELEQLVRALPGSRLAKAASEELASPGAAATAPGR
jgi:arylsulfatase A-like enzyme/Flp pilus assembly protein TadD